MKTCSQNVKGRRIETLFEVIEWGYHASGGALDQYRTKFANFFNSLKIHSPNNW
jgi:hypothetical protein